MMNPAQFKHRISFLKLNPLKDADGFPLPDDELKWVETKKAWAMIKTLQGKEFFQASTVHAEKNSRFIIRYTTGIDASMRIEFKGRIYEIIAPPINDDEKNVTLTIMAKELMASG